MIKIYNDDEVIGTVTLEGGRLKVVAKDDLVDDIMETMRQDGGGKLTDEQTYRLMPFRMTGRVSAVPSGADKEKLRDPAFFEARRAANGEAMAKSDREFFAKRANR